MPERGHAVRYRLHAGERRAAGCEGGQEAGIHKDVTLVGGGLTRFEVWDRVRFEEYGRNGAESLKTLLPKISALGV